MRNPSVIAPQRQTASSHNVTHIAASSGWRSFAARNLAHLFYTYGREPNTHTQTRTHTPIVRCSRAHTYTHTHIRETRSNTRTHTRLRHKQRPKHNIWCAVRARWPRITRELARARAHTHTSDSTAPPRHTPTRRRDTDDNRNSNWLVVQQGNQSNSATTTATPRHRNQHTDVSELALGSVKCERVTLSLIKYIYIYL